MPFSLGTAFNHSMTYFFHPIQARRQARWVRCPPPRPPARPVSPRAFSRQSGLLMAAAGPILFITQPFVPRPLRAGGSLSWGFAGGLGLLYADVGEWVMVLVAGTGTRTSVIPFRPRIFGQCLNYSAFVSGLNPMLSLFFRGSENKAGQLAVSSAGSILPSVPIF